MDWLIHRNPIADMYGPHFLLFYGAVAVATLFFCWRKARAADWTGRLPMPDIPSNPDPYEIAYLRGGENEVARAVIFSLVQRGFLRMSEADKDPAIEQVADHPDRHALSALERRVFDWFSTPSRSRDVFRGDDLPSHLKPFCLVYEQRLQNEKLILPPEARAAARRALGTGLLVLLWLGTYKIAVALINGHTNVGFLVTMMIGASILLVRVCRVPRLSRRGRDYLEGLQIAYAGLHKRAESPEPVVAAAGVDPTLLLVGLFGVSALTGTAYDYYRQSFARSSASGSSCGSGCGSSCSSSGGDGGGCGGGGCGGCGGGGD